MRLQLMNLVISYTYINKQELIVQKNTKNTKLILKIMKQLTTSMPMCYLLPNSDIVTALPYIDQENIDYKTKVQYAIKKQQQSMEYNEQKYIGDLAMPKFRYIDSQQFQQQVQKIKEKIQVQKQKKLQKQKQISIYDQIPSNLGGGTKMSQQLQKKVQKSMINHEHNLIKQINLQLYMKLSPQVQKQIISALDKKKQILVQKIQKNKKQIQNINKQRQYSQYEARQREQTIANRIKVMIYKKKKIQE